MTGIETASETAAVSVAVEPELGAVAIDRGQEDLAGAAALGFACPVDGVAARGSLAAAAEDGVGRVAAAWRRWPRPRPGCRNARPPSVISSGSASAAVFRLTLSAPASIDGRRVVQRPDPAADGERDEQSRAPPRESCLERPARLERGRDVEDHEFVDAFAVVAARKLGRDRPPCAGLRTGCP